MEKVEFKVEFCYCFLGILNIFLNQQGKEIEYLVKFIMDVSEKTYVQLSVFVGLVVGMIPVKESNEISQEISEISYRFFEYLEELTSDELNLLVDFLKEM